ncbi:HAMP domain-containing histidine kinase [Collinsella sp. zg1085]|nr:HAMP domain-containing histidine kinase [Collinsella sp. zg1085]
MLRNREFIVFSLAYVGITLILTVMTQLVAGQDAALMVLMAALLLAAVSLAFTFIRYRRIAELTAHVEAVLHGERQLAFDRLAEGELSILANELDKMVTRLYTTADYLEAERTQLSDALADISHQLKTPLTSLALMCELMRKQLLEAGESLNRSQIDAVVARLRSMQLMQERIQWLVSALLKLARIDAGVVKLASIPVDAAEVVQTACDMLAVPYDLADVTLVSTDVAHASFTGDPSWSIEALENVLKNCMEHTPAGGTVRVWVSEDAISCRIHVEDTGPGIDEADLPHIFERFYRGEERGDEASTLRDLQGVGIGLSLARSLVTAQGGTIEARNVYDEAGNVCGARFDIIFFRVVV